MVLPDTASLDTAEGQPRVLPDITYHTYTHTCIFLHMQTCTHTHREVGNIHTGKKRAGKGVRGKWRKNKLLIHLQIELFPVI